MESTGISSTKSVVENKVIHPFSYRLKEKAVFRTNRQEALIASGFASMALGLLTLFRPGPLLLFLLTTNLTKEPHFICKELILVIMFFWEGMVMFVLIGLGFILTFSVRIKHRGTLLIHPWAIMIMYFDVVVWMALAVSLHLDALSIGALDDRTFNRISHPVVYFIFIYVDCFIFFVLHYIFTTYFIVAELTVIEKCF